MAAPDDEHMPPADRARAQHLLIVDGVLSQVMSTCVGGAFIVSYALLLGASNFTIGVLAALPTLANVFNLASILLVKRVGSRKPVVVAAETTGRLMLLLVGVLPFVLTGSVGIGVIVALLTVRYFVGASGGGGWASWVRDVVPDHQRASFFSRRLSYMQFVGIVLGLVLGAAIDYATANYPDYELPAYSSLFVAGGLSGLVGVLALARTPEPPMEPIVLRVGELLRLPFRDANFRRLIVYMASWNFTINIAAPFFTVFMLEQVGLSLTWVMALTTVNQLAMAYYLRVWGRYAERYSNKAILRTCIPAMLLTLFAWTFVLTPERHAVTMLLLVLLHLVGGVALAGINLASNNIGYRLAPKQNSVAFLSTLSLTNAAAAGLAPIFGGAVADFFAARTLRVGFSWEGPSAPLDVSALVVSGWDFFFLLAFVLGWGAWALLARVHEADSEAGLDMATQVRAGLGRRFGRLTSVLGGWYPR